MWRSSIFEGIDEESELCHRPFRGKSKNLEHLLLQFAVVDTQGSATHLDAVAYKVVGYCAYLLRCGVEQRYVVGIGKGERMVCSHESLFLVAPLEEGEIDNPQTLELVLVAQAQTVAHLQSERTELRARLVGVVAAEDEHEVAVLGSHLLLQLCPHLRCIELVDARLHGAVLVELHIDQSLGTHLRTLHEIGQLVKLLAGVVGTTRHADATDILCLVEDAERSRTLQHVHEFHELHAETQVGLVGTETAHGFVPGHTL